ncbi:uncharacterized protein [Clytia hemisphaerica]
MVFKYKQKCRPHFYLKEKRRKELKIMRVVTVNGRAFYFEAKPKEPPDNDGYFAEQTEHQHQEPPRLTEEDEYFAKRIEETQLTLEEYTRQTILQNEEYFTDSDVEDPPLREDEYFTERNNHDREIDAFPNTNQPESNIQLDFVLEHNKRRALHHNTPPLKWNQDLADGAQKWAEKLIKEHDGKLMHCKERGNDVGENLFVAMSTETHDESDLAVKTLDKWYGEIKDYNFSKSTYTSKAGHFSQVVWAGSQQMGVGYAQRKIGQFNTVVVCGRYHPAGNMNMEGYFKNNVFPPK